MRFTCPNCGARFGSADEPASGRVYSIRCRCGTKLTLAGAAPHAPPIATGARYDPYAASHGLLLDEAQARSLAAGQPILEPAMHAAAGEEVEVTVTFSTVLAPAGAERAGKGGKRDEKKTEREKEKAGPESVAEAASTPRPAGWVPPAWSAPAAALVAFVLAGGGTATFVLPQAGVHSPQALLTRLNDLASGRAGTPPPAAAPQGEPAAPSPLAAAQPAPEAAEQAVPRLSDPGPRRTIGATATAQRGKAPARERKLARRAAADRR